ncbi:hypothetical protein JCM5350_000973 [Sporobolomyces pararoseus]
MAGAVMPLIAQQFVDSLQNATFDFTLNPDNNNNDKHVFPSQQHPQSPICQSNASTISTLRDQGKDSAGKETSPRGQKTRIAEAKRKAMERAEADGVYNWPDERMSQTFHFESEVGYGNWGSLWRVWINPDRELPVAIKVVHRTKDPTAAARVKALWNEYKCLRALRKSPHPNVITFHAFILTPSYANLYMDYHQNLIPVRMSERRAKVYARQLLSGIEHLHSHGITHNDIKPANILLSADDRPVIIDFGFANQWDLNSPDRFLSTISWGTVEYLCPQRAQSHLHDERLSDIWSLGITLYELVVGRTPFEKDDTESFLDRSQVEEYFQRTLTGNIYGEYLISRDFESLIRLMVEVNPHLRLQSCGKALQHRYFDPPRAQLRNNSPELASTSNSPRGLLESSSVSNITSPSPSSNGRRSTPKKKKDGKTFVVFQDENVCIPPRTGESGSPLSPRNNGALTNLTNQSPSRTDSSAAHQPDYSSPKASTPLAKKTPAPSRIPVRKANPTIPVLTKIHKPSPRKTQFFADESVPVPPLPVSTVLDPSSLDDVSPRKQSEDTPMTDAPSLLNRSTSVPSVRRKPVPNLLDESLELANVSISSETGIVARQQEEEEVLSSNRTSPVIFEGPKLSASTSSISSKTSQFLKRSFSKKSSSLNRSAGSSSLNSNDIAFPRKCESPSQQTLSRSLTGRLRKLSIPLENIRRPSIATLAGLKESISTATRRRGSTDSGFSFIEAEPLDRVAITPVRARTPASVDAESQRIRLEAFSSHVQHILEVRRSLDAGNEGTRTSSGDSVTPPRAEVAAISKRVPPLASPDRSLDSIQEASSVSTPRKTKPRGSPKPSLSKSGSRESLKTQTPSPPAVGFKPGHRRIPTAIRNVPSVVLHESGDDGEIEVEPETAAGETSSVRLASPPPPPRVVAPSRQLPTWVIDESDEEEEDENLADVDEPTITIGMTPQATRKGRVPALASQTRFAESNETHESYALLTEPVLVEDQQVDQSRNLKIDTSLPPQTQIRSSSSATPTAVDLPFQNLDSRSESRRSVSESTTRNRSLSHSRSHSVISFFTRSTSSLASVSSSADWTVSTTDVTAEGRPSKANKIGRIRRVVSKIFR